MFFFLNQHRTWQFFFLLISKLCLPFCTRAYCIGNFLASALILSSPLGPICCKNHSSTCCAPRGVSLNNCLWVHFALISQMTHATMLGNKGEMWMKEGKCWQQLASGCDIKRLHASQEKLNQQHLKRYLRVEIP